MPNARRFAVALAIVGLGILTSKSHAQVIQAGCNCNKGGGGPISMAPVAEPMFSAPVQPMMPAAPYPQPMMGPAPHPAMRPYAPARPAAVPPPPGTLGYTYKRFTRPVPVDKHPRIAMIEIFGVPEGVKLTMHGTDGWVDSKGVWHMETEKPPVPGLSLVRKVLVWNEDGTLNHDLVRTVRLIPGRIVELDY